MIGKLTGIIEHILEDVIILNVNGVGYLVSVPAHILHKAHQGESLSLFIETIIRAEMITLYGFHHLNEKALFQKLLSIQGIGGKSAAAILSIMTPEQILEAIVSQDSAAFKRADGVGPKVATRIVTELKDYAKGQNLFAAPASNTGAPSDFEDALSTLVQLGYRRSEAHQALQKAMSTMPDATLEQLIPASLKLLAKNIIN